MKRKITAWVISFAMIFSVVLSMPTTVKSNEITPLGLDKPFALDENGNVTANWDQAEQTLKIKGNGKIVLSKWMKLAQKFGGSNFISSLSKKGWNSNSNFTLKIEDDTVQFPDKTSDDKGGFFENFQGKIEIADIDTSNVTDMNSMFKSIAKEAPDVSKWKTKNVKSMMRMFKSARKANPDVSKWNTSNVDNLTDMFCDAIVANPDVSNWHTSKLKYIRSAFSGSGVVKLDLSNWDVSNLIYCTDVFSETEKLKELKFKGFPKVTKINKFAGKYKVDKLNSDGSVAETYGPFVQDNVYTFLENTGYNVYLAESNPNPNPTPNPNPVNPDPDPTPVETNRISGKNRYETAVKISQSLYDTADIVCIASGTSLVDALNVSSYSSELKAPVLLTERDETAEETLNEISRLKAAKIRIIGGEKVISERVENLLREKEITVERIFGEDRYETALKIAKKGIEEGKLNPDKIFLCSGEKSADALSIASVAIKEKGILLLTDGNTLTAGIKEMIKSGVDVKIIGGVAVISDKVKAEAEALGAKAERIYGNDRFETSLEVYNKYYKESGVNTVYLANGIKMVDALTGSGLANKDKTGILLVRENEMIPSMKSAVKKLSKLKILGGEGTVQDNIWK